MPDGMLRGELYIADDAEYQAEFDEVHELLARFNRSARVPTRSGTRCWARY
jgi:hypothetical protein